MQVPKRQIVDLCRKGRGGNEAERTDVKIAFFVGRIAVGGKKMAGGDIGNVAFAAQFKCGLRHTSIVLCRCRANLFFFVLLRFVFGACAQIAFAKIGNGCNDCNRLSVLIAQQHDFVCRIGCRLTDDGDIERFKKRIRGVQK